jgi:hypothetical protein
MRFLGGVCAWLFVLLGGFFVLGGWGMGSINSSLGGLAFWLGIAILRVRAHFLFDKFLRWAR